MDYLEKKGDGVMKRTRRYISFLLLTGFLSWPDVPAAAFAEEPIRLLAALPADLTALSLEQLGDIEVTSVSRKPEKQFHAAAAVHVITQDDIRRSGATSIPDVLRLSPGVEVARVNANQWAVGIRGFGSRLSRAVLVLIDGRAVYNPLFAGTYWEVQDTMLEDIERIEVVRGPGGALWGANAVNGVINIITRSAKETQGGLVTAGGGSEERGFGSVRYGGRIGPKAHYRVYGKYFDRDASFRAAGGDRDMWHMGQSGFRSDWALSGTDALTVQGDLYRGRAGQNAAAESYSNLFGANVLSRWTRSFDETSSISLQAYYDRTDRHDPGLIERRNTGDIDFQHRFPLPGRQELTWGAGYRATADQTEGSSFTFFDPPNKVLQTYSLFLQDVIQVIPNRLSTILGSKFENNDYSGLEWQPSARIVGMVTDRQTLWAAVSRAVRTPSRLERDLSVSGLADGSGFDSEKVIAYEAGYRATPVSWLSYDLAGYYNDHHDLLSLEPGTPIRLANGMKGYSQGIGLSTTAQALSWWRLRVAYTLLDLNLRRKNGSGDPVTEAGTEGASPQHIVVLHSLMNLPGNVEVDPLVRYVSALPAQNTPEYKEMDLRIAWKPVSGLEVSVVGQNLFHRRHREFGQAFEVQRGVYGKVSWSW
jgi:iron complex outermembrane recepter protein